MRALFWNIRGFGHDGRRRQLIEYMRDEHIDIAAIQETMRNDFSLPELDRLSSHLFAWHWLPSSGTTSHSGGILLGVKDATFEVGSMDRGQSFVSMELFERSLNFKWEVILVYGPADHSRSAAFLEELHRKFMKSWGANLGRDLRERKKALLTAIQALDLRADTSSLSPEEWVSRYDLEDQLSIIYTDEEAYWRVRGSQKWALKGDTNTAYFQAIVNGRRRRNTIPLLWDGETLMLSPRNIRTHVAGFYRALFSSAPRSGLSLAPNCWTGNQLVSAAENTTLTAPFFEGEVLAGIRGMNPTSAPGPDGLPVQFFQSFWNVIKPEIMLIFDEFYVGSIDLGRLNYGIISLIPKVPGSSDIYSGYPNQTAFIQVLLRKGFNDRWVTRVMQMVSCGHTAVNINGEIGPYFPTLCGVRQGDPFSPFLFNMVVDALAAILDKAKAACSETNISNLKFLLLCFQKMSGLKINFDKSDVMVMGYPLEDFESIANQLNCRLGSFPTTYLGTPISDSRLTVADLHPAVAKLQMRIEPWLWRISQGQGGLWLDIIQNKYLRGQPLAFCQRSGGSKFWQSVVQLLSVLRIGTSISVGSGTATLFWFDCWAGDAPFAARFLDLFSIAVDPSISLERALIDLGRLAFQRPFGPPETAAWRELLDCVALHELVVDAGPDQLKWRLESSGQFSTKSLYQAIAPSTAPPPSRRFGPSACP
ncbi:uncharacterized protein [Aegilops tauschii subsp. strangulata]|uniref:uncharacterized protein n=1 Tax=Aegilops tauschii subsp. strangulata TaxID=200361 RepID=UPI003CC8DCC4